METNVNDSNKIVNSNPTNNHPLAIVSGQTGKDETSLYLPTTQKLSKNKLPNNELLSKELDTKSNEFIDSKIMIFKEYLLKYGNIICPKLDVVNNENNEIYDYPIVLFQDLYEALQAKSNSDDLYKSIEEAYLKITLAEKVTEQVVLPMQITLGIMLTVYQDKVGQKDFVKNLEKIRNLSVATCYNYINAAKMIDIIDDERIFSIGLKPLYTLYSMYKKGKIDTEIGLSKALIDTFCNITSSSMELSDDDFVLAIKYVIFAYNLGQLNIDKKLFGEIFIGKYEWKNRDLTFIKSNAYKKDANGINQICDAEFVNKYMIALINNNFNGRLARESFKIALPQSGLNNIIRPILPKEMGNPFTVQSSVSHLLETLDYHSNNSMPFSQEERNELKLIRNKLNNMNL